MRRQLNVKLAIWLSGILLVCGIGTHFLHAFQVKRNAGALLREAEKARQEGNEDLVLTYLSRYLVYEPNDIAVLAQYALALNQAHSNVAYLRSLLLMEEVLRRDPTRSEVRFRLAQSQIAQGSLRLPEAIENLNFLLPDWPKKGEIEHLLGSCYETSGAHIKAAVWLRKAIAADPHRVDSYVLLADILQTKQELPEEAGQVMDALVSANPKNHRAYLFRARFLQRQGVRTQAEQDMNRALELAPTDQEVLLAAADWAQAKGNLDQSQKTLQRALDNYPREEKLYLKLAVLELRRKRSGQALATLRRGLDVLPQAHDLRIFLADLLIDEGNRAEAQKNIDLLRQHDSSASADYLQARLAVADKHWLQASVLLQQARKELDPASPWQAKLHALLGWCYEHLGDTDQQRIAFERAVALDPAWPDVRVGLGAVLLNAGLVEEAIVEFRFVRESAEPPANLWPLLGRALIMRNLRLPLEKRDWLPAEEVLQKLANLQPDSVALALLRSQMLAGQNKFGQAEELLRTARLKQPQQLALWIAQAELAGQQKQWQTALNLLEEAGKKAGDRLELRLALARLWLARGGNDASAALTALAQNPQPFSAEEQVRLFRALAQAWQSLGQRDRAADLWQEVARRLPNDTLCRFRLFELALQNRQEKKARTLQAELARLEGEDGFWNRFARAFLLEHESQGRDKAKLEEAARILTDLGPLRREWPDLPLLEARIAEGLGNTDQAINRYLTAMDRGGVSTRLVERMVRLLVNRRRLLEADQILRKLDEQSPLHQDLARLGAEIALANRDLSRALRLAVAVVNPASRDYRDLLWLARIAQAAGDSARAEETLRRAVKVAGHAPDSWIALVRLLVHTGKRTDADAVLAQAQAKLPKDRLTLTLARCQEILGRLERAEELYRQALQAGPKDSAVLSRVAEFYVRQDQPEKAEPFLRILVDPATDAPGERLFWGRRQLALALAGRATAATQKEALQLVDRNMQDLGKNIADDRARALVLGSLKQNRGQAVNLFEGTLNKHPMTAAEQFALAQLYEAAGDHAKADDLLLDLLAREDRPQVLAFFIRTLLDRDQPGDARNYLSRLERLEPDNIRTRQLKELVGKALQ